MEYVPGAIVNRNGYGNKLTVISDEVTSLRRIILVDVLLNPQQGLFRVLPPERERTVIVDAWCIYVAMHSSKHVVKRYYFMFRYNLECNK